MVNNSTNINKTNKHFIILPQWPQKGGRSRHNILEIKVLVSDKHKQVAGFKLVALISPNCSNLIVMYSLWFRSKKKKKRTRKKTHTHTIIIIIIILKEIKNPQEKKQHNLAKQKYPKINFKVQLLFPKYIWRPTWSLFGN